MSRVQGVRWCFLALAMAGAPAARAQAPVYPERAPADRLARMTELARELTQSYLEMWSSNGRAAVADVEQVYGPIIVFYGQTLEQRHLAAEKRRFLRRWPVRSYALRPGTTRVQCSLGAQGCTVNAIVDWEVRAPARREVSRGSSHFKLGLDFSGPQPTVSSEGGRVIRRS